MSWVFRHGRLSKQRGKHGGMAGGKWGLSKIVHVKQRVHMFGERWGGDSKSDGLTQRRVLGVMGDMAGKASLSLFLEAVTVRGQTCGSCGWWDPLKVSVEERHMVIQQQHRAV